MPEYLELIDQAKELLDQLLDDPEHGRVILKGDNGLEDVEICKPGDFIKLPLGSVISLGVCEYFLATNKLKSQWLGYDMREVLSYRGLYIELVRAQKNNIPITLRYRGA